MGGTRILGIDPGTMIVGWGCLDLLARDRPRSCGERPVAHRARNVVAGSAAGGAVRVADAGLLRLGGRSAAVPDRLHALARDLAELLARLRPDELAIEEAFYGKSVQSAMRIGEARGVILAEARRCGVTVHQFAPARIKRVVTGSGSASKDAVAAMACQQLGFVPRQPERDLTDALAVALCRAEERRSSPMKGV